LGFEGEYGQFALELKSIADVGLVGFPNAGKSSLLRSLSAATPKVGAYPFTTLAPSIGIVDLPEGGRISVADIPGLIEGASEGVGLGHDFLRHIERCSVLLFVLDMSGWEQRDPLDDFGQLRKEIKLYDPALGDRPYLVAGNKMDLESSREFADRFRQTMRVPLIEISNETGQGMPELIEACASLVRKSQPEKAA